MLKDHAGAGKSVLDVGCGDGTILRSVRGNRVGLDISFEMLIAAGANSRAAVVLGSALALPFTRESFDLVICTEVLEHLSRADDAIGQVASVLKSGGIAHFTVPLASWYRLLLFKLLGAEPYFLSEEEHEREFSAVPVKRFTPVSSLISMIENHGFAIEEIRGSFFFPDKVEGPLDRIVNDSEAMRDLARRLDNFLERIPGLAYFGRYLAISCRKTEETHTKSS